MILLYLMFGGCLAKVDFWVYEWVVGAMVGI